MANLVECREYGKKIYRHSFDCEQCGAPTPFGRKVGLFTLLFLVVTIGPLVVGQCTSGFSCPLLSQSTLSRS